MTIRRRPATLMPAVALGAVIAGILFFGLRLKDTELINGAVFTDNGILEVRRPGIAYADLDLDPDDPLAIGPFSIELAMEPAAAPPAGFGLILCAHAGSDRSQLVVGQWRSWVIVMNGDDYDHTRRLPRVSADLSATSAGDGPARLFLITITSGRDGTSLYVDGELAARREDMVLVIPYRKDGSTRIVLANSVYVRNPWHGRILGAAISPGVKTMAAGAPMVVIGHTGSAERSADLVVPPRFVPLVRSILRADIGRGGRRGLVVDVIVNILGFTPLGFLCALLLLKRKHDRRVGAVAAAVMLGFCLSLAIEAAQAWLPSRDSSLLDLALNSFGTGAGAAVAVVFFGRRTARAAPPPRHQ